MPILLIGNTAPHDVLVKRKPTRNVIKTFAIIDCVLFIIWRAAHRKSYWLLKKIFFFKYEVLLPVSQNQNWKFDFHQYFSVRKLYFEILTQKLFVRKIFYSGTLFSDLHSVQKKLLQWSNFTPQITNLICRHLLSFQRNINSHRKLIILNSGTYFLSCPCFLSSPSSSSKPSPTSSSGSTFAHKTGEADNIFLTHQHYVGPLSTSHFFTGLFPTSLSRTSTPLTQGLCLHLWILDIF